MKKYHPYDKSLADKMEQLPLPEIQPNWQEMRRLLDEEMPRGGGYSKRRGGWWLFGTILLFIITGSWMLTTMNFSRQNADPPLSRKVNISPPQADEIADNVQNTSEKLKADDDQILHREEIKTNNPENPIDEVEKSEKDLYHNSSANPLTTGPGKSKRFPGNDGNSEITFQEQETSSLVAAEAPGVAHEPLSVADSIDPSGLNNLLIPGYTPVSRKFYRENRKYIKTFAVREPYSTTGRNFAIGFSLPLGFPLGDQKMLGYNSNAGPNTVTDYLPSPHIQYHFSGKTYIQSEVQFMSPQFIKPVLLYRNYYSNSGYSTTNSVTARKLYYFNLPVSVHYSPFRHFYIGTGLQFSSLMSGIVMREELKTGAVSSADIYKVNYSKFSNDDISARLNGNEMRLLLDANYYWNKFTVGLKYNQALSNYVSTRAAPNVPYTVDKNKALQFYMRYNLWEDKKRNAGSKRMMTKK